ncbi:MAG: extracellular solute-binding protein, partial [Candidatus Promineofilum sp.]|nr:extracellular solute-binding protein [Promineifilum sp.]
MGWRRSIAIAICSMVRRGSRAVAWAIALGWVALLAGCDTSLPEVALVARRASAPAAGNVSELTAWYPIVLHSQWPGELLLSAVQRSDGQPISLTATGYDIIETDFRDHLLAAAATGNAPDVVYLTDTGYLPMLVAAGVLEPLTACRAAQPALARIAANAWPDVTGRGEIWGVPVAQELSVLFFSKPKLRALGWSEAEIDQLPTRIATGDFTLLDLRDTAAAAIDAGV